MRAGNLRYLIEIFTQGKITNELGEVVKTPVLFKSVRSDIKYNSGKETEIDSQLTAIQKVIFEIRYDPAITETMTVKYAGHVYDIRYIEPVRREKTILTCTKNK